ncbi:hypothetical protein F5878DRAFT_656237 [Lentinula raphanica]|uniref:Uncharacterized protein n=1 Tax=Lentinula raphanica TaxID=153919 RepID=A0AA38PJU6_9AGAR|nr:hypothetical protein F5878DRAFT_656237 [Lentinula raphanica]
MMGTRPIFPDVLRALSRIRRRHPSSLSSVEFGGDTHRLYAPFVSFLRSLRLLPPLPSSLSSVEFGGDTHRLFPPSNSAATLIVSTLPLSLSFALFISFLHSLRLFPPLSLIS